MTKRIFHIVFMLLAAAVTRIGYAQYRVSTGENLVPNPSFEQTRACPRDCDYIGGVVAWNLFPGFSADYFHRCANVYRTLEYKRQFPRENTLDFGVPRNIFGYQEAHSGDAYAGVSMCSEAVSVRLKRPLVKDSVYRAEVFVSLSDSSNVGTRYFGMYFSRSAIQPITNGRMLVTGFVLDTVVQVRNPVSRFITDSCAWTQISGFYTARGGERYVSIGGFYEYNDSLVRRVRNDRPLAQIYRRREPQLGYYYVDDVSVVPWSREWAPEPGVSYVLQYIYFEFDRSNLLPESADELDRLSNYMLRHPEYDITITGHTDSMGTEEYNRLLSNLRAQAVANYLRKSGIGTERIRYSGAGSSSPIAGNETAEGRSLNRRVEFVLKEADSGER